jgi:predicted outer membrane repeat protein
MSPLSLFGRALPIAFLAGLAPISSAQTLWFVDASAAPGGDGKNWNEAFDSLQSALDVGLEGDQIWVVAGTYRPSREQSPGDPRSVTFFLEERVSLFGGFRGTESSVDERDPALFVRTVLSGDVGIPGDVSDNAKHVVRMGSFPSPPSLVPEVSGFRITAGNATGRGGGLLIGLDGQGYSPALTVSDCTFDGNSADQGGAIATTDFGLLFMKRCQVRDNTALADGAAVWARTGSLHAANCTFTDNRAEGRGGALWATSVSHGMITYSNCLFARNSALLSGGAVHLSGSNFFAGIGSWYGCTFVANQAGTTGGAFHVNTNSTIEGRADLFNTIVWDNDAPTDPQIHGLGQIVLHCDVQGGYAGMGNIDADPLFRGVPGAEYEPRPGSPVNDAGDNALIPLDQLDLDGDGVLNEPTPMDLDGFARRMAEPLAPDTGAGTAPLVDMGALEQRVFQRAN